MIEPSKSTHTESSTLLFIRQSRPGVSETACGTQADSTAHLCAAAVLELFPETKLGIGPPIDTGFYYDFDRPEPFTPEDLEKIEAKMWEIQARNLTFEQQGNQSAITYEHEGDRVDRRH